MLIPELTFEFNEKFGTKQSISAIKSAIKNRRFKSGRLPGQTSCKYRLFTDDQADWLKTNYKKLSQIALARAFNKEFGTERTSAQIISFLKNHRIKSDRTGHFKKGSTPWNAGTKGVMKVNSGCFKKGSIPANKNPLGSERTCSKDGYILIKVAEPNPYNGQPTRYRHKHHVIWEKHNGLIPESHTVTFIDEDKTNCDINNLELISRAELVRRNHMQLKSQPVELKPTIKLLAKLKTKTHDIGINHHE
jgi:hypothetical protein